MGFSTRKRGNKIYVTLRISKYIRDKRTLKKTPKKLCDGKSLKNKNKYIKKIDIHIGQIKVLPNPNKIYFFEDYLKLKKINKKEFLEKNNYEKIFETYLEFLFELFEIKKEEVYKEKPLIVFETALGWISSRIIEWVNSFEVHPTQFKSEKEIERFNQRMEFIGITDIEVISKLYMKICPEINYKELKEEIKKLEEMEMKKSDKKSFKEFIGN